MTIIFTYFLTNYFNKTQRIDDIDAVIYAFQSTEDEQMKQELIFELREIIREADYRKLVPIIAEHSGKEMKPFFAELFVKYLCDRLTNTPTALNAVFLKQISKVLPE